MNGRDSDQDLYKLLWNKGFEKHTNMDEGDDQLIELLSRLNTNNSAQRRRAIQRESSLVVGTRARRDTLPPTAVVNDTLEDLVPGFSTDLTNGD